jgi:hypothetical protein
VYQIYIASILRVFIMTLDSIIVSWIVFVTDRHFYRSLKFAGKARRSTLRVESR